MILLATLIGTPIGVAARDLRRGKRPLHAPCRGGQLRQRILLSAPSIVIGLFVYELVVANVGHFSGFAGALALAMILLPIVCQDDRGIASPGSGPDAGKRALRTASTRWRVTSQILYKAA